MAIFRVVKPTRSASSGSSQSSSTSSSSGLSSSSSCSSSSDDSSVVKRPSKLKRIVAKPVQYLEPCEKNAEICQVGESVCRLPHELFQIDDLSRILSLDTWNNCLTEKEREQLCDFLPDVDEESFQRTITELLGGGNIDFGNPSMALMSRLKSGFCNPKATKYQEVSRCLQMIKHYHGLRMYHNDKVKLYGEMHSMWAENPDADISERMELWHAASGRPVPQLQFGGLKAVPMKERSSIKLTLKKGKVEGGDEKFVHSFVRSNMEAPTRIQNYTGDDSNLSGFEPGEKQIKSKKDFPLVKHSSNTVVGSAMRTDVNGRKKSGKRGGKKRVVSGIKGSTNNSSMCLHRGEASGKYPLDSRLGVSSALKRNKEGNFKENQDDRGSNRKTFSHLPADGDLSSSDERDFMAEFMSDEEPSTRKRLKRGKDDLREDIHSGTSSGPVRTETSNRVSQVLTSPPLATPNFSFSVLHFLSSVRAALLGSSQMRQQHVLVAFPFYELLRRVQANPGDFRVLSVQEPLEGLLRGALKVLSSKTIRPAVQGWKPLVAHDTSARGWCWIGPLPTPCLPMDMNVVETDAEAWGIPQKMLMKIQDAFISWFIGAQEMLQLLAQLGVPPLPQKPFVLNEKERFQGLRAQRSLITINPTTNEMQDYFQQEEAIRYSLQDTVFFYTTACGEKSAVAPLKRLGGKPNSKARDHLVLKSDRPSHVTILYLVRDAAARLPRSLGTRADVAVLLRDSQYIVEDASDSQLSQVVSGALDRLRYERDPCVQFDADRKLWVYLHADREEEDFEDDGTSSTKRWKRGNKKDAVDSFDVSGRENTAIGEEANDRITSEPDYNSSPGSFAGSGDMNYTADTPELFYNHRSTSLASSFPGQLRDDGVLPLIDIPASIQSSCTNMQSHPMGWEMYR